MAETDNRKLVKESAKDEAKNSPVHKRKVRFALVFGVIIGIALIIGGIRLYQLSRPAFVVEGKAYSRGDYNKVIKAAKKHNISKGDATTAYIEYAKNVAAAEKLGVVVTDEDLITLSASADSADTGGKKSDEWIKIKGYQNAVPQKVAHLEAGSLDGYAFYFPFNRYSDATFPPSKDPNFGKPATIASDKAYAKAKADSTRAEIVAGSTNAEAAIAQIISDEHLKLGNSTNPSAKFSYAINSAELNPSNLIYSTLNAMQQPGISGVVVVKTNGGAAPGQPSEPREITYAFVDLTAINQPRKNLAADFSSALNSLSVKSNVN